MAHFPPFNTSWTQLGSMTGYSGLPPMYPGSTVSSNAARNECEACVKAGHSRLQCSDAAHAQRGPNGQYNRRMPIGPCPRHDNIGPWDSASQVGSAAPSLWSLPAFHSQTPGDTPALQAMMQRIRSVQGTELLTDAVIRDRAERALAQDSARAAVALDQMLGLAPTAPAPANPAVPAGPHPGWPGNPVQPPAPPPAPVENVPFRVIALTSQDQNFQILYRATVNAALLQPFLTARGHGNFRDLDHIDFKPSLNFGNATGRIMVLISTEANLPNAADGNAFFALPGQILTRAHNDAALNQPYVFRNPAGGPLGAQVHVLVACVVTGGTAVAPHTPLGDMTLEVGANTT